MNERHQAQMWFISIAALQCLQTQEGPDKKELEYLRRQLCLPTNVVEKCPVVFVKHFVDHYFTVVLDYQMNKGYMFGRHVTDEAAGIYEGVPDWNDWGGHHIWSHIPKVFRWSACQSRPDMIYTVNWYQVGLAIFCVKVVF